MSRNRVRTLLKDNQAKQDNRVNKNRHEPRKFNLDDFVFVIKFSQVTGKLDPGMRGPYKVVKILPSGRYELKLLSGGYGKTTQAAAQYMIPWRGEWCPETCAAFFESENENSNQASSVDTSSELPVDENLKAGTSNTEVAGCSTTVEGDLQSGEAV
ncbi:uncharacterized protein LOC124532299 [Vanessa cardui]|nr:uncharacterized protein LOC124532299 [Vanessa cardui]